MADTASPEIDALELTADIVVAFVSNNSLPASELPALLLNVHAAIARLTSGEDAIAGPPEPDVAKATAAQIRKSITPDALISFVDGKPYKTLKRHLAGHGLDVAAYRARFGLPADYPTVAPNYSAIRSALAKDFGLGQGQAKFAASALAEPATPSSSGLAKPRRSRPAKKVA